MAAEIFTQSRLQDFSDCAYRYMLRYVKKLDNPTVIANPLDDYEAAVERGSKLHRFAEQYFSGIPQAALLPLMRDDPLIAQWWTRLTADTLNDLPARRYAEITLVAPLGDILLAAKIDLLAVSTEKIVIVDWKTSRKLKSAMLESRIQTKVYRWVVSQASERALGLAIAPENIEMRYCFLSDPSPIVHVSYSQSQKEQDERDILALIGRIQSETDFARTTHRDRCRYCTYRSICLPDLQPATVPADEELDAFLISSDFELDLPY